MPRTKVQFENALRLEQEFQRRLETMSPDSDDWQKTADVVNKAGRIIQEYEAENRKTDDSGRLKKDAPGRLPARVGDGSGFNYHFEPSVREVQQAYTKDPELLKRLNPDRDWGGIAQPEKIEDVADPTTGQIQGQTVTPAKTHLDLLKEDDSAYINYTNHLWEQRMEEAKQKGQNLQRYSKVALGDQPVDYLAGGLEYNIDRRLAPAALGAADSFSLGQATPLYSAVRDLADYELGQRGVDTDFLPPSGEEVINRSPGSYLAGSFAGYALPGNPTNALQSSAEAAMAYRGMGPIAKAATSLQVGAGLNTIEGAAQDFSTAIGQNKSIGEAADAAMRNAPLNFMFGAAGGAVGDMIGQTAGGIRDAYRSQQRNRPIKTLEDAGGETSLLAGVSPPPEIQNFARQSNAARAVGSTGAIAAEQVAPHIQSSLEGQARAEQRRIHGQVEEYFNHPEYGQVKHNAAPIVDELIRMRGEGAFNAPVSQAPRNIDPDRVRNIDRELAILAEPQFMPIEHAREIASQNGYQIIDTASAQNIWGYGGDMPVGWVAVIKPVDVDARTLTGFEQRIDRQYKANEAGYRDPVYADINRASKAVRDRFDYYVDENGNLVSPPSPDAPPPPAGPAVDAEFVSSSPPTPPTQSAPSGPPSSSGGPGGAPPAGPGMPPGSGGGPALPPATMRSVAPEEATPLSLLAGNQLAMPDSTRAPDAPPPSGTRENDRVWKGMDPEQMRQEGVAVPRKFLAGHLEAQGIVPNKTPEEVARMSAESDARWREQFGDLTWEQVYGDGGIADRRVRAEREGRPPSVDTRGRPINNDGNTEPLMRPPQRPDELQPRRQMTWAEREAEIARGENMAELPPEVQDAVDRGVLTTEDQQHQQYARQNDQSLPAPSPKEWTAATDEGDQWYDEIVTPGAPARSSEMKRMADLTEQQRALEEAQAQVRDIEDRFGKLSDEDREKSLLGILKQKLGREVTREDLVKAGLLAGGVAAAVSGEEEGGAAAAGAGLIGLFGPRELSANTRGLLKNFSDDNMAKLIEDPKFKDQILGFINQSRVIPAGEKRIISETINEWVNTQGNVAPKFQEDELPVVSSDGAAPAMSNREHFKQELKYKSGAGEAFTKGGHKVNRGVDFAIKNTLGKEADAATLAEAWSLDGLRELGDKNVKSAVSPWGKNGITWRAEGYDPKTGERAWQVDNVIRRSGKELVAEIHLFKLADNLRNSGNGPEILKKQIEAYRKMGVNRIDIDSTAWVGRYYWPSIGFDRPEAVPDALDAYKDFLQKKKNFSEEEASAAAEGIRSLPSLANAEHGKAFLLDDDYQGVWQHHLTMKLDEGHPLFQLMKKRLDILAAAGIGIGSFAVDDEDTQDAGLGAAAIIGGSGGGRRRGRGRDRTPPSGGPTSLMDELHPKPKKEPRQLEATLDDGETVRGFSALRRQQHTEQEAIERSHKRVGAGGDKTIRDRVIGFNQGDDKIFDEALLEEARKLGLEDELYRAAGASVYGSLRDRAFFGGNEGVWKGAVDFAGLRGDKLLGLLAGVPRNPYAGPPNSTLGRLQQTMLEDPARRLLNLTGGRTGARHGDDARRIYEALQQQSEEREGQQ